MCGDTGQADAAGPVLDDDQRVDAPQERAVHVGEVGREEGAGLGGQELLLGRARATGCRGGPGVMQDLPDRGGSDRMARRTSSPCTRRCPHAGLSVAMRITSFLIAAAAGGRPGRCRLV
jgi:hypothetical protein